MFAVIEELQYFTLQLSGTRFTILRDNNAALSFLPITKLHEKHATWLLKLSIFDCDIQYREGTRNVLADALSRNFKNREELLDFYQTILKSSVNNL